ncbi:hypothetical protein [Sinorhizobium meliloti]|nr:hypothetical protein [Sinorhizobium meliloti]
MTITREEVAVTACVELDRAAVIADRAGNLTHLFPANLEPRDPEW